LGKSNGEKEKGAEEGRSIKDKSEAREDAKRWGKGEGKGEKKARGRRKKYKSISITIKDKSKK